MLVLPTFANNFSLQHFKKHMRAPTGAVLFFQGHHVTWAHRAAILLTAGSQSDASQRGLRQRAVIGRKGKMSFWLQRLVIRAQSQILRRQIRVYHFARVQLIVGVPDSFEFREGLHQFGTKHFWKERATRLPVAMFSGKRTAVANYQIRGTINELTILSNAFFTLEIEAHAHVNATMPEVPIKRTAIVVLVHQFSNVAQIAAQLFRRDRGVVPSFPLSHRSRSKRGGPRTCFAQVPYM